MEALSERAREVLGFLLVVRWATRLQALTWVWGQETSYGREVIHDLVDRELIRAYDTPLSGGADTSDVLHVTRAGCEALGVPSAPYRLPSDGRLRHQLQLTQTRIVRRREGWTWREAGEIPSFTAGEIADVNRVLRTPPTDRAAFDEWYAGSVRPQLVKKRNALVHLQALAGVIPGCDALWHSERWESRLVVVLTSPSVVESILSRKRVHLLYEIGPIGLEVVASNEKAWQTLVAWIRYMEPRSATRFVLSRLRRTF
ncbi:MAG: hypothetical protein AMXMBFR53_15590 [Gemmatimonadota bacterium]